MAEAQRISWDADTTFVSDTQMVDFNDIYSEAHFTNDSMDSDSFVWIRNVNNLTAQWASAVCDINLCWSSDTDSAKFELAEGQTGLFSFHFYPVGCGNGYMEVDVVSLKDRSVVATISTVANVWCTDVENIEVSDIGVVPNPVKNSLTLNLPSNVRPLFNDNVKIDILNLLGQKVVRTSYKNGKTIDVSELNNGIYFLRFKLEDRTFTKKFQVAK
jgi:hypothetical protein